MDADRSISDVALWPMRYDLHTHSKASDGKYSPTELIGYAKKCGVEVVALTDHDTCLGVEEAVAAGKNIGTHVVAGIEISTLWHGNQIHIVGLSVDVNSSAMQELVKVQSELRRVRAIEIGHRLEKAGFADAYERTKAAAAPGASITRGNYAAFLCREGAAHTEDKCFSKYLAKGCIAYVQPNWQTIDFAVKAIIDAKGIPVLAHPRRYDMNNKWLRKLIEYFKDAGGEAMEVSSGMQIPAERIFLGQLSAEYGLYASAGSDFHHEKPYLDMGVNLALPEGIEGFKPVWRSEHFKLEV